MAPREDCRIFISYAHRDGKNLALRLQQSLKENRFDAWLDSQRLLAGRVWTEDIEREIDTRQVTIALLSPGSYASEICRAEQLRALDHGNRVIPVLAAEGADRPLYLSLANWYGVKIQRNVTLLHRSETTIRQPQVPTLISLVHSRIGITIAPLSVVKHSAASVVACNILDRIPMSQIGMAFRKGTRAPVVDNFRSFALKTLGRARNSLPVDRT